MGWKRSQCGRCSSRIRWNSTSILLLLATLVNIAFATVGGLLLYLASLQQIEDSVEELSGTEIELNANALRAYFTDVFRTSKVAADTILLNGTAGLRTFEELQKHYFATQLATLKHADTLYAVLIGAVPLNDPGVNDPAGFSQSVWWDPLSDPAAIKKHGGDRVWVSGYYLPAQFDRPECHKSTNVSEQRPMDRRCVDAYSVSPDGEILDFLYSYPDPNMWFLQSGVSETFRARPGWEVNGSTFWRKLSVWESSDGTLNSYGSFVRVLPRVHIAPFQNSMVFVNTYVSFYGWFDALESDTEAAMLAAILDGSDSAVLASNIDVRLLHEDCVTARDEIGQLGTRAFCIMKVSDLPERARQATEFLVRVPHNTFWTTDLAGDAHWVRKTNIFTPQVYDHLPPIDLMWLRAHSTVQEKVKRSLINFVCFVVGAAVLSTIVLTLLVLGISVPLGKTADAMRYLDDMELERAEAELPVIRKLQVVEVSVLIKSVRTALVSLKMFREFLPQSCLGLGSYEEPTCPPPRPEADSKSVTTGRPSAAAARRMTVPSVHSTKDSSSARSSSSAAPRDLTHRQSLGSLMSMELETRMVSVAAVNVVGFLSDDTLVQKHKALVSLIVHARSEGVLDGCFGDRCRVSWNGPRIIGSQRTRAATFVESMRSGSRRPRMPLHALEHADRTFVLSVAATSGTAKCGFAGCEGNRFYTIVGRHVSFTFALERVAAAEARRNGSSVGIIPWNVQEDASTSVQCRFLMRVRWRKMPSDTVLYETTGLVAMGDEEWMYIVGDPSRSGVWWTYNEAVKHIFSRSTEAAVQALKERRPTDDPAVEKRYAVLFEAATKGDGGRFVDVQDLREDPIHGPVPPENVEEVES
eukprot:TRINITY_DN10051_c1_g1_i2.p1 TRINITY_DN10051_c1_g1~~TRINITY_DN10051_c1_g1_i2.p1  ORF type:complete len:866 (+),score=225.89 TRINITY_DN10051_c1_g1_i2:110-2707(+)